MNVDFSKCVFKPWDHQARGVLTLMAKERYGMFWEMRLGKTKAIIDTASFLREQGRLDAVVLAVPAQVKDVWAHKELGEIRKHCFVPWRWQQFDSSTADYADMLSQATKDELLFLTVSHEFLRQEDAHGDFPRAHEIASCVLNKNVWVVFDEAAAFGNWKSLQWKSAEQLKKVVNPWKLTILDGTPIGNHPVEQYSKFGLLGKDILGYDSFFHFRAVHQTKELNPFAKKGIKYVGFQNQDRIDRKVRAYCEYLEQKDCLDMPEKVPQNLVVRLKPKTWRHYCDMRDEMIAELDSGVCQAQHASVKVLRLAQMAQGFVGGIENEVTGQLEVHEIGDETAQAVVEWLERRYAENVGFKCVVWCRFRPEIERLSSMIASKIETNVKISYGGKKTYDGELHPDHPYSGPMVVVAQAQSLRYGVNMSKADTEIFVSQDYNRITRSQAVERLQAPNGRSTTLVVDVLVEGPNGQRTVTWDIKESLEGKDEVARRTAGEWKRILTRE